MHWTAGYWAESGSMFDHGGSYIHSWIHHRILRSQRLMRTLHISWRNWILKKQAAIWIIATIWIMSIKKALDLLMFIIVPTFINFILFYFFKNGLLCNSDIYITFILTQYLNQLNITNKQIKIFSQKQTRFYFILFLNVSESKSHHLMFKKHYRSHNTYSLLLWQY